ncbi:MAG: hypothetical protein KIS94_10785 [Chitinophagales bacterium]|nr:hypothetical protein [Chitinophagales bacterium]
MIKTTQLILLLFISALTGCGGKTSALLEKEFKEGKVKLTVSGNRSTSVEAWRVDLSVKAYNFKEGKLSFEIYAADLNDETVSFLWEDDNNCKITFIQRDGVKRTFHLIASPEQLQLAEVPVLS